MRRKDAKNAYKKSPSPAEKVLTYLILFSLFLPGLLFLFGKRDVNYSKEPLSAFPEFELSDRFAPAFDRWWNEHFPLRSKLVTAHNKIMTLFSEKSATERVISGRGGWLYYEPTLDDYLHQATITPAQARNIARSFALMQEAAEEEGAKFLAVFVPNKATIYPEHMPRRFTPLNAPKNMDLLRAAMPEALYLDELLLREKSTAPDLLYHKEDSHWNLKGAKLGYEAVLRALEQEALILPYDEWVMREDWKGDLANMLWPSYEKTEAQFELRDFEAHYVFSRPLRSKEDADIESFNPAREGSGSMLIYRDSFANAWIELFSESFEHVYYSHSFPYRWSLTERLQPDYLVIAMVERNIPRYLSSIPPLQAPDRPQPDVFETADALSC